MAAGACRELATSSFVSTSRWHASSAASSGAAFADVWCAIPKVVFSRTLDSVQGNARLAEASLTEEIAAALDATDKEIGGAGLAAQAIELGLVDELRIFRNLVVVGGGTPFLPPVTEAAEPDRDQDVGSRVIYERYGRAATSRTDSLPGLFFSGGCIGRARAL